MLKNIGAKRVPEFYSRLINWFHRFFIGIFFFKGKVQVTTMKNNFSGLFFSKDLKIKRQQNQIHFQI